jgi:hypothetical protein
LGKDEPVDALIEVVQNESGDEEHEQQSQHAPCETLELIAIGALLERPHEEEDAEGEQAKADYLMVIVEDQMQNTSGWDRVLNQDTPQKQVWYLKEGEGSKVVPVDPVEETLPVLLVIPLQRYELFVHKEDEVHDKNRAVHMSHCDDQKEATDHDDR